jgi:hypothetical protein
VSGQPAQAAYPLAPTSGVTPTGPPYAQGAASGQIGEQPQGAVRRFERATLAWRGGPYGLDRPVGRAFVVVQRRVEDRWRTADSDLGLGTLWKVDGEGNYRASWEVPRDAATGRYRLQIRAKRYRLTSRSFRVRPSRAIAVRRVSASPERVAISLDYPVAVRDVDLRYRPPSARGGVVRFQVCGRAVTVRSRGTVFEVSRAPGQLVSVPAGAARDRHGNRSGAAIELP